MKAIVIRQPWATLVALGLKQIETRPAPPNGPMRPEGVRGLPGCSLERGERIAIVAGARAGTEPGEDLGGSGWYWESTAGDISCVVNWKHPVRFHDAPLGAVVCTVRVDDALPIIYLGRDAATPESWIGVAGPNLHARVGGAVAPMHDQLPLGDFTPGRWGWMLSDPRPCDPIPCKGRQGVFELPAEVAEALS